MTLALLQVDFPFAGPWGEGLEALSRELAADIAAEAGLRWKVWTESEDAGVAGGVYLFESHALAEKYLHKHSKRLAEFGVQDLRAIIFDVNGALTAQTRGPI